MLTMQRRILFGALILAAGVVGGAEITAGHYAYPMQWDDNLLDVATDVSFLNEKPAGAKGRIVAENGHFYTSEPRERIRFLGIGMGGDALFFLSHQDMDKIAVRLAKAGVNVVRFHGFDGMSHQPFSMIDLAADKSSTMKPEQFDRFLYMVGALKKQGIYSVIGALRMVRYLKEGDGAPAVKSEKERRYADRFDRNFIASQKEWARELLGTVNPYTGMTLAEDPALLAVEINNESSMLYENKLNWFVDLHPFYQKELGELWNRFLREKYQNGDIGLHRAWDGASPQKVAETPVGGWQRFAPAEAVRNLRSAPGALSCRIDGVATNAWDRQLKSSGLALKDNQAYILKGKIRHAEGGRIGISLQQANAPFHGCGLNRMLDLPAGKTIDVEIGFLTKGCDERNPPVLHFNIGKCPGELEISDLRLLQGRDSGLRPEHSLSKQNIPLPFASSPEKDADWREFLTALETQYTDSMRDFLRSELKVGAAITDTQINWPGMSSIESQRKMEYVDVHSYWGHPRFLGRAKAWDFMPGNWVLDPAGSVIPSIVENRWSPLEEASRYRVWNKPLVISETDYPYPQMFASEMMPIFAAVFCRQDWDSLNLFIHGRVPGTRGTEGINHMFDQTNHPGKIGFFPAAALIYRTGMIEPAPRSARLLLPREIWRNLHHYEQAWGITGYQRNLLNVRSEIAPDALPAGAEPVVRETGIAESIPPIRAFVREGKYFFTAEAPSCGIVIGALGGERVGTDSFEVALEPFEQNGAAGNFASAVVVARDGKPLAESESILLTLGSSFLNHDVVMSPAGDTITELRSAGGKWWGSAPVVGVRLAGSVRIRTAPGMRAWLLDSCGKRLREARVAYENGFTQIPVAPEDETIFYEIATR